jgi:hypothetical protein
MQEQRVVQQHHSGKVDRQVIMLVVMVQVVVEVVVEVS